jgi:hypothetical protein
VAVQILVEILLPTADLIGACEDCGDGIIHRTSMASSPRRPLASRFCPVMRSLRSRPDRSAR